MHKRITIGVVVLLCLVAVAIIGAEAYVRSLAPKAKARAIQALSDRFDANVEIKSLRLTLVPVPAVSGEGLVICRRNYPPDHPLIKIDSFSANASLWDLVEQRDRVDTVALHGLEIHIPPNRTAAFADHQGRSGGSDVLRIRIRQITADRALVEIEPKTAGKDPLRFPIDGLNMWSVGMAKPFKFDGKLQNAKPPGFIHSTGYFGPWQKDDPRSTAIQGNYVFTNADLGAFKGIQGTLASNGVYRGRLEHIEVLGETNTPNFALKHGGAPVALHTRFHGIVDGTDGDTTLDPVVADFGHSRFVCEGGIEKKGGDSHKTVDLNARTTGARMEDILQLVTGEKRGILTGAVEFHSHIVIPPGEEDVLNKLLLDGQFKIARAEFTSEKVEQRLFTLSDRARGITASQEKDQPVQRVASNFDGRFRLARGQASFSQLMFEVPGAQIRLAGDYNLLNQGIDLKGVFRMDATLSQTQQGVKRFLLKPFDPLFKKDGAGFEVPLEVSGTRSKPEVSAFALHHKFTLK